MMQSLTTPNLIERHHTLTKVVPNHPGPYGIRELAVTVTGQNVDLDHYNFLRHGCIAEHKLPAVLALVSERLAAQAEEVVL